MDSTKHYSYRTGQTYDYWIRRYILFHQKCHPQEMDDRGIRSHL
ncbi:MAG: phage integrase N-terminal SAM-like domain-containing protein [Leptolyngbyaceae cyanobacterium]